VHGQVAEGEPGEHAGGACQAGLTRDSHGAGQRRRKCARLREKGPRWHGVVSVIASQVGSVGPTR
jgi:hypothetical protein